MAQFNLKALGKKIAELLGGSAAPGRDIPASAPLPPSPQGPQIIGMPPPPQALPTGPDPAELAGYQAQRQGALQTIGAPVPQPSGIDPIEAVLSMIAGGGVKDLGVLSRTAKIPGQLAAGRDAQAMDQWKMGQDQAGVHLGDAQKMIGGWYDRESQNAKIEGMLKQAEMRGKVTEAVQQLKSDQAFQVELAKIPADQYTPARIYPLLEALHPDLDPEALQQMAQEMYQSTLSNPSFKMKQEAAKTQLDRDKQTQHVTERDQKTVEEGTANEPDILSAYIGLWRANKIPELPFPPVDAASNAEAMAHLKELAKIKTVKRQAIEAGTEGTRAKTETEQKLRQPKIDHLVATTGVSLSKAKQLDKELGFMDENHRVAVARAWAAVGASNRSGTSAGKAGGASPTTILQGINSAVNGLAKERASQYKDWTKLQIEITKATAAGADAGPLKAAAAGIVERINGIDKESAALKVEQKAARGAPVGTSEWKKDPKTGLQFKVSGG